MGLTHNKSNSVKGVPVLYKILHELQVKIGSRKLKLKK
jgi:hypothetical protein